MKKALVGCLAFCMSVGTFSFCIGGKPVNPVLRDMENVATTWHVAHDPYLNSFENPSFSFASTYLSFSGALPVYRLFELSHAERPQIKNYRINFDLAYITDLDLGRIEVSLINPYEEETIMTESIYVYPFEDDRGNRDIEFFMNDISFLGTEYVKQGFIERDIAGEVGKLSAHSAVSQSLMIEKDVPMPVLIEHGDDYLINPQITGLSFIQTTEGDTTPGTSGIIYPIVQIAVVLTSIDASVGLANKLFPRPDYFIEGATAVVYYHFKHRLAFYNFLNNSQLAIPRYNINEGWHINSQNMLNSDKYDYDSSIENGSDYAWAKWKFGLSNLKSSGCPVFSFFNLLIDSNSVLPDLAPLVSLFELCNADLLFAKAGVLPLDSSYLSSIETLLTGALSWMVLEIASVMSVIPFFGLINYLPNGLILSYLVGHIVSAVASCQGDMGDILSLFAFNYSTSNILSGGNHLFDAFKGEIEQRRQGIICFWNNADNIMFGAHFVYVRNDVYWGGKYYVYNLPGDSADPLYFSPSYLPSVIDSGDDYDDANRKVIAYYVIE